VDPAARAGAERAGQPPRRPGQRQFGGFRGSRVAWVPAVPDRRAPLGAPRRTASVPGRAPSTALRVP